MGPFGRPLHHNLNPSRSGKPGVMPSFSPAPYNPPTSPPYIVFVDPNAKTKPKK